MQLVDTHCHLQFPQYESVESVVADAVAAGVAKMICVGTSVDDSRQAVGIAGRFENVWASVGSHPHEATGWEAPTAEEFKDLLGQPKVVAIGEIGLDYYRQHSGKPDQLKALRNQLEVSAGFNLPYIFHVREAWEDFWPLVDEFGIKKAVVHSFSAHRAQLDEILRRGFYVGLNGIMTFTKDEQQLAAAKAVPADRLLLETDAPFLTPKPYRGKVCEPKHVRLTAEFLAELRQESLDRLAASTTANAKELFGI